MSYSLASHVFTNYHIESNPLTNVFYDKYFFKFSRLHDKS